MPDLLNIPRRDGGETRISLKTFKGSEYLDLRQYFTAEDGTAKPSRKGVTIPLWAIPDLQVALSDAVRKTSRPRPATVLSLAAHRARHDAGLAEYDSFDCAPAFSKMQDTANLIDIGDQGAKP